MKYVKNASFWAIHDHLKSVISQKRKMRFAHPLTEMHTGSEVVQGDGVESQCAMPNVSRAVMQTSGNTSREIRPQLPAYLLARWCS